MMMFEQATGRPMTYDKSFLESARAELEEQRKAILQRNREKIADLVGDVPDRIGDTIDVSTAEQTDATELRLHDRLKDILHEIDYSLRKIDEETYGECEECGEEISRARLKAYARARYCIECKERMETQAKRRYKRPGLMDEFSID
jgi:DnaK suppressor protein